MPGKETFDDVMEGLRNKLKEINDKLDKERKRPQSNNRDNNISDLESEKIRIEHQIKSYEDNVSN